MAPILDTFSAPAFGTADTGEVWTLQQTAPYAPSGAPQAPVASGFTQAGGAAAGTHPTYIDIATIDHGWASGTIELDAAANPAGVSTGGAGIVFRWTDSNNFWHAFRFTSLGGGHFVFLRRVQAGALTNHIAAAIPANVANTLKVEASGSTMKVYWAGVQVGATITHAFNAGATRHGLGSYFQTAGVFLEYRAAPQVGLKVWDGATWVQRPTKVWDGAAWVARPVKVWDGASWVVVA